MKSTTLVVCAVLLCLFAGSAAAQVDTAIFRPVGYHPSNIAYFNTPYFSNALYHGGEWYEFSTTEFGNPLDFNSKPLQFINGYPQFLDPGQKLRGFLFGLNINDPFRPAAWPARDTLAKGHIVMTWQGNADVRLVNCTFVAGESNGAETGLITNGRRIYQCASALQSIEVHAIQTPITDLKVWLAPPDDPATPAVNENQTGTLEGQMFHPLFLQRIADRDWGFIRFMDWGATNASPVMNWEERRKPAHIFMNGIIKAREPSAGSEPNRETGVAYENMIALCNATGRNMWINIPHLATDEYITKLAQLIRFGSDGSEPFTTDTPNAPFPPLNPGLKVYVEFSNEIWSSGFAFAQGDWALEESVPPGVPPTLETKARFTAHKFCDTWKIFQTVFGGTSRLVRVAAVFTANLGYTDPFLEEIGTYGTTLSPAVRPDVLAVTTYFGNGIQDFVNDQGYAAGRLFDDAYWTGPAFVADRNSAFDEWTRRMLAGDATTGAGPDATGIGGGFSTQVRDLPITKLGYALPVIAYEGGPSLFTDSIDSGNAQNGEGVPTDDGVTTFVEAMNRDPKIADIYRIHLEIAKSKGLWTHTPYTDTSTWSRFGQWGHLETLDASPSASPKYALMLEHFNTWSTSLRHVDTPIGAIPQFSTGATLPPGIVGQAYTTDILTTGGNGARTATLIGKFLEPGFSIAAGPAAGTLRITGTPSKSAKNFIMARVNDADGDPAWRIFTLQSFGGPGTLVQSDFRGTDPALHRPWTPTFVLSPRVTWSGWDIGAAQTTGAGVTPLAGNDAFQFSVEAPAPANETLDQAVTDNEFLKATVTPVSGPIDLRNGEVRFSTRRIGFHSPIGYALYTSIGGFSAANAVYVSAEVSKDNFDEIEHVVTLPNTAAFSAVNSALELRIYAFGAQFDGHATSLTGFKLTEPIPAVPSAPTNLTATASSATQVELVWTAPAGAVSYEIFRRFNAVSETLVGTSATPAFTDSGLTGATAFVYRVRAQGSGGPSPFSNADLATTVMFTTDPLVASSTKILRTHLMELRTAVNAVRATAGRAPATLTDSVVTAGSTKARAVHITELRTALSQALTDLGIPIPSFGAGASAGSLVRASHFQELRAAVR